MSTTRFGDSRLFDCIPNAEAQFECFLTLGFLERSMGVIGRYSLERAELYFSSLKENGLTIDMVQVDDD